MTAALLTASAVAAALAVAVTLLVRDRRRLRAALADARQEAAWLHQLLERRGGWRRDAAHDAPAGPRLARLTEPPRHG